MAHLVVNKDTYQTDEKKIGFVLSLLNEGEAGAWKEQFIQEAFDEAMMKGGVEMTFSTFAVIRLKIEYPWIIHFSLILYSN